MNTLRLIRELKAANDENDMYQLDHEQRIIDEYLELTEYDLDTFEDCEAANDAHAYVKEHFGLGE